MKIFEYIITFFRSIKESFTIMKKFHEEMKLVEKYPMRLIKDIKDIENLENAVKNLSL